jgi:hypothetical protein
MNADIYDLNDVKKKNDEFFDGYDAIVYAGWLCAERVVKIKWFQDKAVNWKNKRLAVVAVGGSPNDNPDLEKFMKTILTDEQSGYIKAFYCQGGFNYEKMNAPSRMAMKMFVSTLKKKPDEKTRQMAEMISNSYDISDKKFINPVVSYLKGE